MADAELDFSELLPAGDDIEDRAHRTAQGAYPLVKKHALELQRRWKSNARSSAGSHGKLYPRSITAEQLGTEPEWEIGPDRAFPQGSMGRGFEYGSVHQPPHLDGAQATTAIEPAFNKDVDELVRSLL